MAFRLNDQVTASGQITPADVASLKDQGFQAVVTVRPDGEMPGQPSQDDVRKAAEEAGLRHAYLPVVPGSAPSQETAEAFAQEMTNGPIFAYCGKGPRVALLTSLAEATQGKPVEDIIGDLAEAGFDLSGAAELIKQYQKG